MTLPNVLNWTVTMTLMGVGGVDVAVISDFAVLH